MLETSALAAAFCCAALGCGGGGGDGEPAPIECSDPGAGAGLRAPGDGVQLPAPGAAFDYQLGAAYPPSAGVSLVVRDRTAAPAPGAYNVCYVNGFQTQPDEEWSGDRADLVLQERGRRVEDADWPGEYLLDISTADKRERLVAVVGAWVQACAATGFDAVELDNLDSFTRSSGRLGFADVSAYAVGLLAVAHRSGLAVAQKNTAEASACLSALGFDFAVAEECWGQGECDAYTAQYGDRVYDIEYETAAFERGCDAGSAPRPILRDLELVAPGSGYVRRQCP